MTCIYDIFMRKNLIFFFISVTVSEKVMDRQGNGTAGPCCILNQSCSLCLRVLTAKAAQAAFHPKKNNNAPQSQQMSLKQEIILDESITFYKSSHYDTTTEAMASHGSIGYDFSLSVFHYSPLLNVFYLNALDI